MRNLVQGNNDREGSIQASKPPPSPPPRALDDTFIQRILDNELSDKCIAIRTLSEITKVPPTEISNRILSFRNKVAKSFAVNAQWRDEKTSDEYYFDLTAYSLFRVAATLIPTEYSLRSEWIKILGEEIYKMMKGDGLIPAALSVNEKKGANSKVLLTDTIPILQQILGVLQTRGVIESFRLGDKNDDARTGNNIFDIYDDEDLRDGLAVNCLISLFRPATLTSSLQITGEGSRFMPEFIGTTIAAMWKEELGLVKNVAYETYFVDAGCRPNPKDYFPNEQLLQYTIKQ